MEEDEGGWEWADLLSSPGYTLVAGMLCGVFANLLSKHIGPAVRPTKKLVSDLATRVTEGPAKMVLVVRTDLGMQKGKAAAQCAHAAVMCYKKALVEQPKILSSWETLGQTKVCLRVGSEAELLQLAGLARDAGLVSAVVRDAGRAQVEAGSFTVLGIGPGPAAQMELITGNLRLY
jgi:PTH2 family peptidyl-tRNA hydrolase